MGPGLPAYTSSPKLRLRACACICVYAQPPRTHTTTRTHTTHRHEVPAGTGATPQAGNKHQLMCLLGSLSWRTRRRLLFGCVHHPRRKWLHGFCGICRVYFGWSDLIQTLCGPRKNNTGDSCRDPKGKGRLSPEQLRKNERLTRLLIGGATGHLLRCQGRYPRLRLTRGAETPHQRCCFATRDLINHAVVRAPPWPITSITARHMFGGKCTFCQSCENSSASPSLHSQPQPQPQQATISPAKTHRQLPVQYKPTIDTMIHHHHN